MSCYSAGVERVVGIGGIFFRSRDPEALKKWYADHLGIPDGESGHMFETSGPTVWCPFPEHASYFGPGGGLLMINYRVNDLEAILEQLRSAGVAVDDHVEDYDYGRFGWATDPEGNRFELWQPPNEG